MLREVSGHQSSQKIGAEEICYYDRGQGSPVVLIHGMFGDFLDWEPVLEPLAASHRVIAVDLPGQGTRYCRQAASGQHLQFDRFSRRDWQDLSLIHI